MENHRRNLEKLCRICGGKVTTGKGYWNVKDVGYYEDVMLQYFFIKITEESSKLFNMKIFLVLKKVLADKSEKLVQFLGQY